MASELSFGGGFEAAFVLWAVLFNRFSKFPTRKLCLDSLVRQGWACISRARFLFSHDAFAAME